MNNFDEISQPGATSYFFNEYKISDKQANQFIDGFKVINNLKKNNNKLYKMWNIIYRWIF